MRKITLTKTSDGREVFVINNETVMLDCGDTAMVAPATKGNIAIAIGPDKQDDFSRALEQERTEAEKIHSIMNSIKNNKFEYKTLVRFIAISFNASYYFDMILEAMDNSNRFAYPLEGTVNADDTYGSVGIYIGKYATSELEDKYFEVLAKMKDMIRSGFRTTYYDLRTEFVDIMDKARCEFTSHGM